jgi:hypothetical protein
MVPHLEKEFTLKVSTRRLGLKVLPEGIKGVRLIRTD